MEINGAFASPCPLGIAVFFLSWLWWLFSIFCKPPSFSMFLSPSSLAVLHFLLAALLALVHIQPAEENPCVSDNVSHLLCRGMHRWICPIAVTSFCTLSHVSWSQADKGHLLQVQVNVKAARAMVRSWPHKSILISVMRQPLSWSYLMLSNQFKTQLKARGLNSFKLPFKLLW